MRQVIALAWLITMTAGPTSPPVFAQLGPAPTAPSVDVPAVPATTAPPGPVMPGQDLDARALANRAINRELNGDRPGAIADLSAAIAKESDPAHRASMEHLLQLLQSQP